MSEDNAPAEWLAELPEQLRNAPFIGKAENIDDAIGKLAHAAQYMGQAIKLPAEGATEEENTAFFDKLGKVPGFARIPGLDDIDGQVALLEKLGAPAELSGYTMPEIAEFEWSETLTGDLRQHAKETGMTKAQFAKFAKTIGTQEQESASSNAAALTANRKAIKEAWGDSVEERENIIRGWLDKSTAPESMITMLNDNKLPLDTMTWLHDVANQFKGEVTPIHKDGQGSTPIMDPVTARARIQEILNHPAYFDNANPLHKDMVSEMLKAQKLANAKQSA
jgi:hypothetical protein